MSSLRKTIFDLERRHNLVSDFNWTVCDLERTIVTTKSLRKMNNNPRCLYNNRFPGFLNESQASILGTLIDNYHGEAKTTTIEAWKGEIFIMQDILSQLSDKTGRIVFEYDIPRLGKRIDVVLLYKGIPVVAPLDKSEFRRKHHFPVVSYQSAFFVDPLSDVNRKKRIVETVNLFIDWFHDNITLEVGDALLSVLFKDDPPLFTGYPVPCRVPNARKDNLSVPIYYATAFAVVVADHRFYTIFIEIDRRIL